MTVMFVFLMVNLIKHLLNLVFADSAILCFSNSSFELVLFFKVLIVEGRVEELLIVDPVGDHMGVLFMEVDIRSLVVNENILAIVANVVSSQRFSSIDDVLSPEVGVRSALVHGSVRLKRPLNE